MFADILLLLFSFTCSCLFVAVIWFVQFKPISPRRVHVCCCCCLVGSCFCSFAIVIWFVHYVQLRPAFTRLAFAVVVVVVYLIAFRGRLLEGWPF